MSVVLQKGKYEVYWLDRILPQICTASAYLNMKHVLQHMQYGFAVIYGTLITLSLEFNCNLTRKTAHGIGIGMTIS